MPERRPLPVRDEHAPPADRPVYPGRHRGRRLLGVDAYGFGHYRAGDWIEVVRHAAVVGDEEDDGRDDVRYGDARRGRGDARYGDASRTRDDGRPNRDDARYGDARRRSDDARNDDRPGRNDDDRRRRDDDRRRRDDDRRTRGRRDAGYEPAEPSRRPSDDVTPRVETDLVAVHEVPLHLLGVSLDEYLRSVGDYLDPVAELGFRPVEGADPDRWEWVSPYARRWVEAFGEDGAAPEDGGPSGDDESFGEAGAGA